MPRSGANSSWLSRSGRPNVACSLGLDSSARAMWLGFLELTCLSALAIAAGLAIAVRMRWEGRAELYVGASILAHALVTAPTLALGWFGVLYQSTLAITSAVVSLTALGGAFVGTKPGDFARELGRAALGLVRVPFDAFALALRPPSLTLIGLAAAGGAILWTAWATYLTPSSSWDGLWCHESVVGFALQNHGVHWVAFPEMLTDGCSFPRG